MVTVENVSDDFTSDTAECINREVNIVKTVDFSCACGYNTFIIVLLSLWRRNELFGQSVRCFG